ncbi:MAG: SRPBCC family protein [Actinomycetota bacterium]|nr:SRPBCC family protein [Actinomycetota bacterium]
MTEASRELLAPRADVWALVSEPYNLPDWWPAYTGVRPDRRGLAPGARWRVSRGQAPGFLRRSGAEGLIVISGVAEGLELRWNDVQQGFEAGIKLANAGEARTLATVYVDGPAWRLLVEGARDLPKRSLGRLHDLCQTAAGVR